MSLPRAMKPILGWFVAALVILPIMAVPIGGVVDLCPRGAGRGAAVPLGLAAPGHAAEGAIPNNPILAAAITAISLAMGVGRGRLVAGRRFPGRDALSALAMAPGAIPPLFAALGIVSLGRFVPLEWDATWRWV